MQPIDLTQPVPDGIDVLWDARGVRFDRDGDDPEMWWYDIVFSCAEDWDTLRRQGPYYTAPPQDWTWAENIRPETDYYARIERVHHPFKEIAGVCRSSKDGGSLVFEDGLVADRYNDIVKHAFPIVPTDRLSLPTTVVLDLLFKTQGLDELKEDVIKAAKATYDGYGR